MKLTVIENDENQRVAKDAEGNLYADVAWSFPDEDPATYWLPIESYNISFPEGEISIPFIPDVKLVVRPG